MSEGPRGGRLTTHVLDTMSGLPAAGLLIELHRHEAGTPELLATVRTNADGRCDAPLLQGEGFEAGLYELRFHVGAYLRHRGVELPEPAFLDVVPVLFGVAEPQRHYHVPLLVSAYGYATYRGS